MADQQNRSTDQERVQRRARRAADPPTAAAYQEERTASRLELFFDLAYVLVIAELAATFAKDLGWHGAAVFAGLFVITWWSWVTTTLYANRFDTNDLIYRLAKLRRHRRGAGNGGKRHGGGGSQGETFAVSYLATRLVLLALYARAYRHVTEARATIAIYLGGTGAGAALWAVSLAVPGTARYVLWAAGVLVEASAPVIATRFGGGVPLHVEHLPERFGLFVILVLGESIASVVVGVHDTDWARPLGRVAAAGFVAVAALWWIYFDLGGAAGKRRLVADGEDQESGVADAYVYGHLPLTLGLAAFAVGIEQFIVHPTAELSAGGPWALHAGAALFLTGIAAVIVGTSKRLAGRLAVADRRHPGRSWSWASSTACRPGRDQRGRRRSCCATVLAGIREQRRGTWRPPRPDGTERVDRWC